MFINISNHHSSKWGSKQLEAASHFGSITDVAFPPIDPNATTIEVENLVTQTLMGISIAYYDVIHVMGEMGFTFAMVKELKARGIKVMHSTSERKVVENADGTKVSNFEFVQFREYS